MCYYLDHIDKINIWIFNFFPMNRSSCVNGCRICMRKNIVLWMLFVILPEKKKLLDCCCWLHDRHCDFTHENGDFSSHNNDILSLLRSLFVVKSYYNAYWCLTLSVFIKSSCQTRGILKRLQSIHRKIILPYKTEHLFHSYVRK